MIKRKLFTTIFATIFSNLLMFVLVMKQNGEFVELTITYLGASLIIIAMIFLYGVPVSFLSDLITKPLTGMRRAFLALLVHLIFGCSFGFLIVFFTETEQSANIIYYFVATIVSFLFWVIDEILRYVQQKSIKMISYY